MLLPKAFIDDMSQVLSPAEMDRFVQALSGGETPVSIRWNAAKVSATELDLPSENQTSVPWCKSGRYLPNRPQFTLDPLLHAGTYYVQEASSQFVSHVISTLVNSEDPERGLGTKPITALDLCAAPGGKSTAAIAALPQDSILVSNEIDRKRARILAENIQKWGNPNICVTVNAPADFRKLRETFDLIITDVPCSGEGMFRKDEGAIAEWNPAKVRECAALQKQIVTDIWPCLKPGGFLIYSTCTFNVQEDEANIQFIHDQLGGEIVPIPVDESWNIHPALTGSFAPDVRPESACRFMPHCTQGEGLFMALIHKPGHRHTSDEKPHKTIQDKSLPTQIRTWISANDYVIEQDKEGIVHAFSPRLYPLYRLLASSRLYILSAGVEMGIAKGKDFQPAHALALSTILNPEAFPTVDLDLDTALNYLRREAIVLPPDTPRGYVLLSYRQHPLGFVKNIGNRCNSLYPTEWRIRNL